MIIPVYKPYLGGNEKKYVNECLDTTWISSRGEFISRFERAFANYIGADYATSVANGTVALHLAMESLGITKDDEVIVPSFTYIASVNTILQTGAKVVFADSSADTLNVTAECIKNKITDNTKAVIVVHLYGLPCDMGPIVELCERHGIFLIEDCAEAFGSRYLDQHVGTFGDVATFSFFGNKTITTGEGGMVVCKKPDVYERACHLKSQGVSKSQEYWHDCLAYNYRMTNICAAIGLAQLEQADKIIAKKRQVADWYQQELIGLPLRFHSEQPKTFHSFWMCTVLLDNKDKRQELRNHLKSFGVETRPLFPPAHKMPHTFDSCFLENAENISARGINLPSYPDLTHEDVLYVTSKIKDFKW